MRVDGDNLILMRGLDELVDFSHGVPVKCVKMWSNEGESDITLYTWTKTVRSSDSLVSTLMDLSLYGWTIDCVHTSTEDRSEVDLCISRQDGKYNTNITSDVVEKVMGLTWVN